MTARETTVRKLSLPLARYIRIEWRLKLGEMGPAATPAEIKEEIAKLAAHYGVHVKTMMSLLTGQSWKEPDQP